MKKKAGGSFGGALAAALALGLAACSASSSGAGASSGASSNDDASDGGPQGSADGSADGTSGSDGTGSDASAHRPLATRFASASTRWSVPKSSSAAGVFATSYVSEYANETWTTMDLDGDGRAELVFTSDASRNVFSDGSGPYWKVYKPAASGFATSPTRWSVPTSSSTAGVFATSYLSAYATETWTTMDLDGDGKPELVFTSDSNRNVFSDGAGPYWKVFKGTANGFATAASRWAVPRSTSATGIFATSYVSAYGAETWTTTDLDGDGKPELVVTSDASRNVFSDGAGPYWQVYKANANGFAPTATRWAVPRSSSTAGVFATSYVSAYASETWTTTDLDGDGKPELVFTSDANRNVFSDGSGPYWKVFRATASGFASAATRWAVPVSSGAGGVFATSYVSAYSAETWTTTDLDGDGRPELVFTSDASRTVFSDSAGPYWKVYKATASGFTTAPGRWAVPKSSSAAGVFATSYVSAYSSETWSTMDLDGDGRPELVFTSDPSRNVFSDAAGPYWKIYAPE